MTDVPSKHVWKIKESRIVFKALFVIRFDPGGGGGGGTRVNLG